MKLFENATEDPFLPCDTMLARYMLLLCVCLSVCSSICQIEVK